MDEYWGPYDKRHDLDLTRVEEMPREQGAYDNGWQLALVWCRTHMRFEWLWVQLELFPPEIRLKFIVALVGLERREKKARPNRPSRRRW
jgi:hypothetical protein